MSQEIPVRDRPDYGLDRPDFIIGGFVLGAIGLILGPILFFVLRMTILAYVLLVLFIFFIGILGLTFGSMMYYGGKVGKLRERDLVLSLISWNGNEKVLDIGCGPGLLVVGAAKKLTTGKAVGVDMWDVKVETGNTARAALENARIEGVSDRVEVKEGDVRNLPFDDGVFDIVLARALLNHIDEKSERKKSVQEIVRVMKPGGRLLIVIVDTWNSNKYLDLFKNYGLEDVKLSKSVTEFTRIISGMKKPI